MLDVSVVVPFYNPGANIEDCLASLRAQTLAAERYEVILVDDGSGDGSDKRVQRYVDLAPDQFRMIRIPASGWPGRPRNVGVDAAQGRYVQFVDSDDSLHPRALERLLEIADGSDADIVVGKLTSDFRGLNHHVFRHTVTGRTIHDYPLVDTLTPHKMVRKRLLTEHGIRFAEGPRHVEDEHFSMQIYTRARSVAVVGDLPCYYYRRRRVSGRNLGDTEAAATDYFRDLAAVLDVIDEHVEDPEARIPLQRRFYRTELLGRLRGKPMNEYADSYRREVLDCVRALATTRFAPDVRDGLPVLLRTQSRLMLDDNIDGLTSYSAWLDDLRLVAQATSPTWAAGQLAVTIEARLSVGDEPLRLERDGQVWLVPAAVAPGVGAEDRIVSSAEVEAADLDCATISRADSQLWSTTTGLSLEITHDGQVTITGEVRLDPSTLQGGRPLEPGLWDLRLRATFGGVTFGCPLLSVGEPVAPHAWLQPSDTGPREVQPFWTSSTLTLALDVGQWSHALAELLDEATPAVDGRRLELMIPRATGKPASYPACLMLTSLDEFAAPSAVDATVSVTPTGATLRAKLPRRMIGESWQCWVRIGEPGGSPPTPLPWQLAKEGRVLVIRSSSGVPLRTAPNSTSDTSNRES